MAERKFSEYATSGELGQLKIGGTATTNVVQVKDDMQSVNIAQDNSGNVLSGTEVQTTIGELADVGLANMIAATPLVAQGLTVTPEKLTAFSSIKLSVNGTITPDVATQTFTINKDGWYQISGIVNAEFPTNAEVSLQLYKNGIPASTAVQLPGRGTGKPVIFSYIGMENLVNTDYLEIWATADGILDFTVVGSSMIVEKTIFQ